MLTFTLDSKSVELTDRITRSIQDRTGGQVRNLRVEVQPERVILYGRSPSYYCKQLASQAGLEHAADRLLTNAIDVL